jgi:hypothetical protein
VPTFGEEDANVVKDVADDLTANSVLLAQLRDGDPVTAADCDCLAIFTALNRVNMSAQKSGKTLQKGSGSGPAYRQLLEALRNEWLTREWHRLRSSPD